MMTCKTSINDLTKVASGTPNHVVAKIGRLVAQQLKLQTHAGQLDPSHPLYDKDLSLCINSYYSLGDLELAEGELIDEFYDVTERLYDWAETHHMSFG